MTQTHNPTNNQDIIIKGNTRDLGGFSVHRSLPTTHRRSLGPFVFIDHMGPMNLTDKQKLDVRPHPHIGLSTVTYLYSGRGYHRDSLGSKQIIEPGAINLMVAGSGIVHSERTPEEDLKNYHGKIMNGLQVWLALPVKDEECTPDFLHYPKDVIPKISLKTNLVSTSNLDLAQSTSTSMEPSSTSSHSNTAFGSADAAPTIEAELLMGEWNGYKSPVKTFMGTLFLSLKFAGPIEYDFTFKEDEIGFFVVEGSAQVNNQVVKTNELIIINHANKDQEKQAHLKTNGPAVIAVFGGNSLPEPRYMWWNFVSSNKENIHVAAAKWKNQEMGQVPEEVDFIPLPDAPPLP